MLRAANTVRSTMRRFTFAFYIRMSALFWQRLRRPILFLSVLWLFSPQILECFVADFEWLLHRFERRGRFSDWSQDGGRIARRLCAEHGIFGVVVVRQNNGHGGLAVFQLHLRAYFGRSAFLLSNGG